MNASIGGYRLQQRASEAEQAAEEMAVIFKARNMMRDSAWWNDTLEGFNSVTAELPSLLSLLGDRFLAIPEADERGKEILRTAVVDHVENFMQKVAYARARAEAQALADAGEMIAEEQ